MELKMSELEIIFNQLDNTRLSLHKNLIALDDELAETYEDFLTEFAALNDLYTKLV